MTRYGFTLGFHVTYLLTFNPKAQWNLASEETRKWMPWMNSIFLLTLIPSCTTDYDGMMCNCQSLNESMKEIFFLLLLLQTVQSELKIKVQIFFTIFCFSRYSKFSARHNLQGCWNRKKCIFLEKDTGFWSHLLEHKQEREHDVLCTPTPPPFWMTESGRLYDVPRDAPAPCCRNSHGYSL